MKLRYYGSSLSLSDVDPNNSYGWKLSFRKGGIYSFLIGMFGAPHLGARIRHRILTKILKEPKKKLSVLDVGCGFGLESLYISEKGYLVKGIDVSQGKINIANKLKKELKDRHTKFDTADIYKYRNKKTYDYILLFEVLEHVTNPGELLMKLSKIIKKGGEIVVSFPSMHKINSMSKDYLGHTHIGYDPKTIRRLIKGSGLRVKKVYTFGNNPLAKILFYIDYYLLRYFPLVSAVFFFISYPIAVLDFEYFTNKNPMGYVVVLKKTLKEK